jgi:hypothetical protein
VPAQPSITLRAEELAMNRGECRSDTDLDGVNLEMLMIKYLQMRNTFAWSLSNLVALLRQ